MTWFKNLQTMTKLMISFGFLAVIMAVLGYEGVRGMAQANEQLELMYQRDLSGMAAIKDVNIAVITAGRQMRATLLATDAVAAEASRQKVEAQFQRADEAMNRCERFFLSEQGKIAIAKIRPMVAAIRTGVMDLLATAMTDKKAAIVAMAKTAALAEQLDAAVQEATQLKAEMGKSRFEGSQRAYEQKRATMLIMMVVALGLAIGLGLFIGKLISTPLSRTVEVLQAVAAGDLTRSMTASTTDEVGQMATALNAAVASMHGALVEVRGSADGVASASQQLAASSEELSSGAQEQASGLEETSASLQEITSSVKQNADNARQANQLAVAARETAEKGGQVVSSAVTAMGEINTASKRIADIIATIDEIAFQTNLLALNAAVEAARAGEQGRGFAVVASEVRSLAQRSATAAKEIKSLIQDSVRKVEAGSEMVNQSGGVLLEIVSSIKRVADIVAEIAAASREQSTGVEQVAKAMSQMDQVTQQNSSQTEELSSTAQSLAAGADQLQALTARFQLDQAVQGRPPAAKKASASQAGVKKSVTGAKTFSSSLRQLSARTGKSNGQPATERREYVPVGADDPESGFAEF